MLRLLLLLGSALPQAVSAQAPKVILERRLPLEQLEAGTIADGDILPDGRLVLLDQSNRLIYRFAADGRIQDSIGRRGKGPGEFEMAGELEAGPNGDIAIADMTNRRITIWRSDKTVEATPTVTELVFDLSWSDGGLFLKTGSWDGAGRIEVRRLDSRGTLTLHGVIQDGTTLAPVSCDFCDMLVDDRGQVIVAAPDTIFAAHQVDKAGASVRRFTRPGYRLARWSRDELSTIERQARQRGIPWDPSSFQFKRPLQNHSVAVDGAGRVWLRPTVPQGEGAMLVVFSPDGRHLATLGLQESLLGFAVRGDRLLGWGENQDGAPAAYVFRIR